MISDDTEHACITRASCLMEKAACSATRNESCIQFANSLGLTHGFNGYVYHTVPAVLQAWFLYPENYRTATLEIIRAGGDTDSTAAIQGAVIGAHVGNEGIPADWRNSILQWPRNLSWIERLGSRLHEGAQTGKGGRTLPLSIPAVLLRNILFLAVVLLPGLRRLLR